MEMPLTAPRAGQGARRPRGRGRHGRARRGARRAGRVTLWPPSPAEQDGPLLRLTLTARREAKRPRPGAAGGADRAVRGGRRRPCGRAPRRRADVLGRRRPRRAAGGARPAGRGAARRRTGLAGPPRRRRRLPGTGRRGRPGRLRSAAPAACSPAAMSSSPSAAPASASARSSSGSSPPSSRPSSSPGSAQGAARALFVTGERFGAERALRIGLVSEVVDDLDAGVERVVAEIPRRRPGGGAAREADRAAAAGRQRGRAG